MLHQELKYISHFMRTLVLQIPQNWMAVGICIHNSTAVKMLKLFYPVQQWFPNCAPWNSSIPQARLRCSAGKSFRKGLRFCWTHQSGSPLPCLTLRLADPASEILWLLSLRWWTMSNIVVTAKVIYLLTPWSRVLLEKLTSKLCS
jgi:hypothetical protein